MEDVISKMLECDWLSKERGRIFREHKANVKLTALNLTIEERKALKTYVKNHRDRLRQQLWMAGDKKCYLCSHYIDLSTRDEDLMGTIDHVVPVYNGGGNHVANLKLAHKWCNEVKGHKEFTIELAQEIKEGFDAGLIHPFEDDDFYQRDSIVQAWEELDNMVGFQEWANN